MSHRSPTDVRVKVDGDWGYIDRTGWMAIKPR
jgi:hypothetical protein